MADINVQVIRTFTLVMDEQEARFVRTAILARDSAALTPECNTATSAIAERLYQAIEMHAS